MKPARKAGPTKSWVCIVALTFLLPAGASQLANVLMLAVAHSADKAPIADERRSAAVEAQASDCQASVIGTLH